MDEKREKSNDSDKSVNNKKEEKPDKNIQPPKFFLISEGVISKTELKDLSQLVKDNKENYSTNK